MADNPGAQVGSAIAEELGKDIYATIKRQLSNLCCFTNNVKSMNEKAQNLGDVRAELKKDIDDSLRDPDAIILGVQTWCKKTDDILREVRDEIEPKIRNSGSGCWTKTKAPFSLGTKVVEKTKEMEKLRNEGSGFNRDNIFHPAPALAMLPFQPSRTLELESRKLIEDCIVKVLNQGEAKTIGICGMGGSGKTTLAEKILSRMQTEGSFTGVVEVVVSRPVDLLKIQQVIMDSLDFKEEEKRVESLEVRARLLSSKLQGPKKLLILLDDIWETFSLEKLGIPREGGCATLITSRDKEVLDKMCDNKIFGIGTLPQDEARFLFEEKAGIHMNDPNLRPMAEQIAEECGGLPLAIVTIGSALRNKGKQLWDRALRELQSSRPVDGTVYVELHQRLVVSYELLDDADAKFLFLLCSLFPEDHQISIDDLALYTMGLNEVDSLVETRDRVWQGVDKLKNRYLLLEGGDETLVKMHDVIRDVAIFIASKEKLIDANWKSKGQFNKNCKWIAMFKTSNSGPLDHLPMSNFQDLRLLIIHNLFVYQKINDISILKEMHGLNALSFKGVDFEMPQEIKEWPNNLITLQLNWCFHLKTLSFVGALLHLKILDCDGCEGIAELPVEIGQLKCLKLLSLSGCKNLQRIAPGIIKQLDDLEELKMLDSFRRWESSKVNDKEGMNVPLNELASLHKLTCLEIEMDDISLAHEKIGTSSNLVKYKIGIPRYYEFATLNCEKVVCLGGLPNEMINDGSWIRNLLATTSVEGLCLDGDGSRNWWNLSQTHNTLRGLKITNCGMLKELVHSSTLSIGSGECEIFPMLEHLEGSNFFKSLRELHLNSLPSLTHLLKCAPNQQVPFNNLREVKISECGELLNLFLLESANDAFTQLETLEIEECAKMKQVFISNGKISSSMTFPKLKELNMSELPSLSTFWKGSESIEFPYLEALRIGECEQLKSIVWSGMESESEQHNCGNEESAHKTLHLFCTHKVHFGGLKSLNLSYDNVSNILCPQIPGSFFRTLETLVIRECHKIESLFSSSIVENFVKLNYLHILNCDAMEEVFRGGKNEEVTFPKLRRLTLEELPSLSSVGKGIKSIDFPMLEELEIHSCQKLKRIVTPEECNEESGEGCNKDDESSFHFLFDDKVKLSGLKGLTLIYLKTSNIFCPQIGGSFFRTLMRLDIRICHNIRSLFSSSMVENLVNLNFLRILNCHALEEVLRKEKNKDEGKTSQVTFPKLKTLQLGELSSLISIGKGIENIDFPMLEDLVINNCPKLKSIVSPAKCNDESGEGYCNDDEPFPVFGDDKVKFNNLKRLYINGCKAISSVFSSSATGNLTALSSITIKRCMGIKQVITGEKEIHNGNTILFPSLETLKIENTPLLERFCEWKCPLELSMLEEISIDWCLHLKILTSASLTTPKLKKLSIDDKILEEQEWKVTEDLNRFLCEHTMDTREVWKKLGVDISEPCQLNTLLLPHHPLPLTNVVRLLYKSSGKSLVAATSNADPKIWDWQYGESSASSVPKLKQLPKSSVMSNNLNNDAKSTQDDSSTCVALSIYDKYMAYASGRILSLFDMDDDFKVLHTFMAPSPIAIYVVFDSDYIAIGMDDFTIQIYNWRDGKVVNTLKGGHEKQISGLAYSESLYILVSSGADAQLCVLTSEDKWETKSLQAPPGHLAPLDGETRIQFRVDQYHLLAVHESQIAIYDPELECLRMWYPRDSLPSPVSCAAYSCDGRMIYTGFHDGAVGIFDFEGLTLLCRIAPSAYISSPTPRDSNAFLMVMDIAAHPKDPHQFALGMSDGAFYVIEPSNAEAKSKGSTSLEGAMLPSISTSSSMKNRPSETQSSSGGHLNNQ